jgi:NAD(P)-dependent dehydrogenase (short-subunit alcohol dehydrogenase family)
MTNEPTGRSVIITGGTSGVGLATAHRLAADGGTRLALIGRNVERGKQAQAAVAAAAPRCDVHFVPGDANDPGQALAAATAARDLLGGVDVLVNSTTAFYVPALLRDIPIEDIADILIGQALGPMHMCRAVLPWMAERGGSIVNVASDAAKVPTPGEVVIGAAMAAIVTFTRTLAVEAKRDRIRVNAVTPSLIEGTETGDRALAGGFSKKLFEKARQQAHLGPTEPDDLADLIVFLAGPGSARITGQVISVNGGISVA